MDQLDENGIVDTHLHIWAMEGGAGAGCLTHPWLDERPAIKREFVEAEYRRQLIGNLPAPVIKKCVFVQAEAHGPSDGPAACEHEYSGRSLRSGLDEARWVQQISQQRMPEIKGIVAWAPLSEGARIAEEWLTKLCELNTLSESGCARIVGIRQLLQPEGSDFCLKPNFVESLPLLAERKLVCDFCLKGDAQLEAVLELVKKLEAQNVQIVLDHCGKPDIQGSDEHQPRWHELIERLAKSENVCCKLSGLSTEAGDGWLEKKELHKYLLHVLQCFGVARCLYGSDWPVCTLAAKGGHENVRALSEVVEAVVEAVQEFSSAKELSASEAIGKVFRENAERVYGV